ncbi:MAG: efflux RND transporter periplasmic adaptor subunit [Desulfovibrio sp.]|jgi:membrane fusion protein (multidrug efflux system)|nr:efflux RND transporter periplasmic adaptor subunit [Desulfovibrio sp.]
MRYTSPWFKPFPPTLPPGKATFSPPVFPSRGLALWGALLALSLAACGSDPAAQDALPQVTYMAVVPQKEPLILKSELPGRTSPYNISEVRPQISGIIQDRLFEQGDLVVREQPLYQIDTALYAAAVDSAAAALQRAQANAQAAGLLAARYRKIVNSSAVSKQEYDNAVAAKAQAEAEIAAARAALDAARINLGYTTIRAPIAGHIGRSSVTPGALVTQNQTAALATIQQLDPIYVDLTQSSTEMLRLRRAYASGQLRSSGENAAKVKLLLPDGSLYTAPGPDGTPLPVEGDLLFSEVSVEPSTGSVTLRAVFPNAEGILLPGMFVRAIVEEGAKEGAILLPQKTVVRDNRGRATVNKLVKNSTLQDQAGVFNLEVAVLTLSASVDNDKWLVADGLQAGDLILVDGLLKVQRGKPVRGVPQPSGGL